MKGYCGRVKLFGGVVAMTILGAGLPAVSVAQYQQQAPAQSSPAKTERSSKKGEQPEAAGPAYSKEFRKEAAKVQKLIDDKKWPEVVAALPAIESMPALSDDELKVLATWRLQATQATGDTDAFTAAIEHFLARGYASPDQVGPMHQQLAAHYNGKQDRARTLEHYRAFVDATPDVDGSELQTLGRLYMQNSNYTEAPLWLGRAIDGAVAGGQEPEELWFQLRDRCFIETKDEAARLANFEALVGYYPKKEYYSGIIALYQSQSKGDRVVMLNAYRLAVADPQGGLATVGGYLNYADIALTAGSPGEAARGLERGMKDGVVPSAGSNQATLQEAKDAVATDRKSLAAEALAAEKSPKGEVSVKVALGYYSTGEYDKTVELVRHGIEKGGVGRLDDANLLLGAALMELGRSEEAKTAFQSAASAAGANPYLARIAAMWLARMNRQAAAAGG